MKWKFALLASALAVAGMVAVASAQGPQGPPYGRGGGWGPHGKWGRHWDPGTVVTLTGSVTSITKITPYSGMSHGVHVELRTEEETISIHLGPAWYLENQDLTLKKGDKISVRGSRITYSGKPAVIAAEVHRGSDTLQLRDESGYPLWAAWRARKGSSTL
jgi:hypothetical protein